MGTTTAVSAAATSPPAGDLTAFCAAMADLSTAGVTGLADIEARLDALTASAPPGIADDVAVLVTLMRGVAQAFDAAGAPSDQAGVTAVIDSLTPEQQAFVRDVAAAANSGSFPDSATGRVFALYGSSC